MIENLRKLLAPTHRRVMSMIARGVVKLVDDAPATQRLQLALLAQELRGDLEHFQTYGLTSVPTPGAEALVVFLGGNRDHGVVVVAGDRRYRIRGLKAGEVCLYDDLGSRVHLKRGGEIVVSCSAKVTLQAPLVAVDGDLEVAGNVSDAAGSMHEMRTLYNVHVHPEHDGGSTGAPAPPME